MNREEFLQRCKNEGYCRSTTAKKYAKDKDSFMDDDFITVFRIDQQRKSSLEGHDKRFTNYQGARCTKRLVGGIREDNPFMHHYE